MNRLLETELTAFLDYEKYDRLGMNSGNFRNGEFKQQTVAPYKRSNDTHVEAFMKRTLTKRYVCVYLDLYCG